VRADRLAALAARHAGRGETDPWRDLSGADPDDVVDAFAEQDHPELRCCP
jgi:hypothetical protein